MNKFVYKLTTAVSTAALLTGSVASVAFGTTTVTVSGNGADSNNDANVTVNTSKSIYQTNTANIQNNVNISSNTGDNTANKNTGGDVSIETGDANVSSSVSNSANSNVANVSCGGCPGDLNVSISGNGADSKNDAKVKVTDNTLLLQTNNATVKNNVDVDTNTGGNTANKNTDADVEISTGDSSVEVDVTNKVNQNVASLGGGNGGSVDIEISGNGADSKNKADVKLDNKVKLWQTNNAKIANDVDVEANTGYNKANKNTGGDVSMSTGDSDVEVAVTNEANSNALALDECCGLDLNVKVANNGADSKNDAKVNINSELEVGQQNDFSCGKSHSHSKGGNCADVNVDSNTGDNKANSNTASGDDPVIETGDADADVEVSNKANSNVLGDIQLPNLPDFNWNGWFLFFMGKISN